MLLFVYVCSHMDHWHHIKNRRSLQSFGQKKKKLKKRDEHILTLDRRRKKTGHGEKSNPFPFLVPASFFSFSFFFGIFVKERWSDSDATKVPCPFPQSGGITGRSCRWWYSHRPSPVPVRPQACAYQRIWLSMFETGQLLFCPGPGSRPAGGHVLILRLKEVFVRWHLQTCSTGTLTWVYGESELCRNKFIYSWQCQVPTVGERPFSLLIIVVWSQACLPFRPDQRSG